jgi:phosphatidylethanolamine-binding protein (PEBP) family uncharacterized protein
MHWISPLVKFLGDLFIGVVRRSGNNVQTTPLSALFTQSVQSFYISDYIKGAYYMATCVPSGQASIRYAVQVFGLSRPPLPSSGHPLNGGLPLREHLRRPL